MISEQVIAAIIGAAVVGGLKVIDRLLDFFLPTDHHYKGVKNYAEHDEEDTDHG